MHGPSESSYCTPARHSDHEPIRARAAFGEERRRNKVIPHAFGERAVYAALIRASQSWQHIVISEFELKQIAQLRDDLKTAHTERHVPLGRQKEPASHRKIHA